MHQEFFAPRILYTKIRAPLSGHSLGVVFCVLGVLDVLVVLAVLGVLCVIGVFGVLGVLGVLHVLVASLYWGEETPSTLPTGISPIFCP